MSVNAFLSEKDETGALLGPRSKVRALLAMRLNQLFALALLILISPLFALVAYIIWRVDGAPIFFAHYRVGRDGKLFACLKFRSMLKNSEEVLAKVLRNDKSAREEWARNHKLSQDPRITPIGHFLRRTSLDELPQLINVVRGEMSLVGPRPITVAELTKYGKVRWHYLSVCPGITGLWQVSGRNNTSYEERVELDRFYVERKTRLLDLKILLKTVWVVVSKEGAR